MAGPEDSTALRTVCVWCPDWPVAALRLAGHAPATAPVAVVGSNGRVRAVSGEARRRGLARGLRRREAQARCPDAVVVPADPAVEVREFEERVVRPLEAVTPRLAVERPGLLTFPAGGPRRWFGTDEAVGVRIVKVTREAGVTARVGAADGAFAARLAARHTDDAGPVLVLAVGETPGFLASQPVATLGEVGLDEPAGRFLRLGVRTLGDLASLPAVSVATRFGPDGARAHRLARGVHEAPALVVPPPDLTVTTTFDPPATRVGEVVFAGKRLADDLLDGLSRRDAAATEVSVVVETERGERHTRRWRHPDSFTAATLARRIHGQLDAWLHHRALHDGHDGHDGHGGQDEHGDEAGGGVTLLRLVPEELVPARGRQLGLFGADPHADERASQVFSRLQGMLGKEAVVTPTLTGGRTPIEQATWVPWGDPAPERENGAWPGSVPAPAAARVFDPGQDATLVDAEGQPVVVSGRGELSAPPARLSVARGRNPQRDHTPGSRVRAWAGPWVHDLRWWDPAARRRRALFQVITDDGAAWLVTIEGGRAAVTALYD